jgi:hypothetical protein
MNGEKFDVIEIVDWEQSSSLGNNRGWCTANNENDYKNLYSKDKGELYMFFKKGKKKPEAQLFLSKKGSYEFKLKFNKNFGLRDFFQEDVKILEWLKEKISFPSDNPYNYEYSDGVLRGRRVRNDPMNFEKFRMNIITRSSEPEMYIVDGRLPIRTDNVEYCEYIHMTIETTPPIHVHDKEDLDHIVESVLQHITKLETNVFMMSNDTQIYLLLDRITCFEVADSQTYSRDNNNYLTTNFIVRSDEETDRIMEIHKYYPIVGGKSIRLHVQSEYERWMNVRDRF